MQNVRLLNSNDRTAFVNLIESHNYYAKEKKLSETNDNLLKVFDRAVTDIHEKPLNPKIWGAFNSDGGLDSVLNAWYFARHPYWCFNWVITDAKFRRSRREVFKNSGAGLCMDQAIKHAEHYNRFIFYWAASLRNYSVRQQMFMDSTELMHRYAIGVELVVPAGDMPKFEYQQLVFGPRAKAETWVIKQANLQPKFRFDLLNNKGLLPVDYDTAYTKRDI